MINFYLSNKFDSNNDASDECENERIFPNLLEFTWIRRFEFCIHLNFYKRAVFKQARLQIANILSS